MIFHQFIDLGEVVRLKTGGVKMTVDQFDSKTNEYRCRWFDGTKLFTAFINNDALTKEGKP